jgi:DsbC/DsbD-like thiol-disulfide interchange protein
VKRIGIILASLLWLTAGLAQAAHTQARLLLATDQARPGDTVVAGVALKMEEGWHTYWKNPGAAGQATEIKWQLPPGVTAGEIQWPLPEKLPPAEVTTYGYQDEVVLLVPLKLAANLPPGPLEVAAKVSWLECKDACIPAAQTVQASLTIGATAKASADASPWPRRFFSKPKPGG